MTDVGKKSIAIGSDHSGFRLKEILKVHLRDQGHEVNDCGTFGENLLIGPTSLAMLPGRLPRINLR